MNARDFVAKFENRGPFKSSRIVLMATKDLKTVLVNFSGGQLAASKRAEMAKFVATKAPALHVKFEHFDRPKHFIMG
jgi:hypothetical protein